MAINQQSDSVKYRQLRVAAENIKVGDEVFLHKSTGWEVVTRVVRLRGIETRLYLFNAAKEHPMLRNRSVDLYNRCWYPVRRAIKP